MGAGRAGGGVADVLQHGVGEEDVLLGGQRDVAAQAGDLQAAQIDAVDFDAAGLRVGEPQQERHHGGLAAAGCADQRHDFAALRGQLHLAQHRRVRAVAEGDMAKAHFGLEGRHWHGVGRVFDVRRQVQYLEDAVQAHRHVLGAAPDGDERVQRTQALADARVRGSEGA